MVSGPVSLSDGFFWWRVLLIIVSDYPFGHIISKMMSLGGIAGFITTAQSQTNWANIDKTLQILVHKLKNMIYAFHNHTTPPALWWTHIYMPDIQFTTLPPPQRNSRLSQTVSWNYSVEGPVWEEMWVFLWWTLGKINRHQNKPCRYNRKMQKPQHVCMRVCVCVHTVVWHCV